MNFKVGDEVVVITGSDKGKKGKILKTLKAENKVVVEGVVFYWNPVDGDTQKSAVIRSFKDIDECLNWISSESSARDECAEVLNEHC